VLLRDRIPPGDRAGAPHGTQVAVLFIDLDRFKTINDSLGHQLGDRLLQSVASRILGCVREGDTVSRVGGDEFVIVIPELESSADASRARQDPRGARQRLPPARQRPARGRLDRHQPLPRRRRDAETLMRNADTAMYHAKDSGRGNFQFFTQHMNVAAQQRLTLENALRRALDEREFELHYQPLFDLRDRSITGFEALLRWNPPGSRCPASSSRRRGVGPHRADRGVGAARGAAQARAGSAGGGRSRMRQRVGEPARALTSSSACAASSETGIDPAVIESRSPRA
jgi:diguanylate cyclase (GGDEF)-like protein